jgi:hypothetical protein
VNDNDIIERALFIGEITGRDAVLAAGDYSMLYQASSVGLKTVLTERPDRPQLGWHHKAPHSLERMKTRNP